MSYAREGAECIRRFPGGTARHRLIKEANSFGWKTARLAGLFEAEAAYVATVGEARHGTEAVREILRGYFDLNGEIKFTTRRVYATNDLAVLISDWELSGTSPETGEPLNLSNTTTDVIRRQPDGTWKTAIDNSFDLEKLTTPPKRTPKPARRSSVAGLPTDKSASVRIDKEERRWS